MYHFDTTFCCHHPDPAFVDLLERSRRNTLSSSSVVAGCWHDSPAVDHNHHHHHHHHHPDPDPPPPPPHHQAATSHSPKNDLQIHSHSCVKSESYDGPTSPENPTKVEDHNAATFHYQTIGCYSWWSISNLLNKSIFVSRHLATLAMILPGPQSFKTPSLRFRSSS